MKNLLVLSLVLNVAFAVATRRGSAPAAAQSDGAGLVAPAPEVACYDANGDGSLDVGDPVALLNWLFLGRDAPTVCPSGGGIVGLPDTGQTGFLGCVAGVDSFYATGCPDDENRFVLNDNGTPDDISDDTVIDNCTALEWQRSTADMDGDGMKDSVNWCDALAYCENLDFAGHDDWRLPNIRELHSIVDFGRTSPTIDDSVFGLEPVVVYWSSTTNENLGGEESTAYVVDFYDGFINDRSYFSARDFVRAVRTAQ